MNLDDAEISARKRLASDPTAIEAWVQLLETLVQVGNFAEVYQICSKLLRTEPLPIGAHQVLLRSYFSALFHKEAIAVAKLLLPRFHDLSALDKDIILNLAVLYKGQASEISDTVGQLVEENDLHEFNIASRRRSGPIEVVFYLRKKFHWSIQKRIAAVASLRGIDCIFTTHIATVLSARPQVIVVSEALFYQLPIIRQSLPEAKIVNTRHGLGDKNYAALGASQCDYFCVSSEQIAQLFTDTYMISPDKIWVTGYPQMDELFRELVTKMSMKEKLPRSVLFAPTYNPGLSAGLLLGDDPVTSIRGSDSTIAVHIRPHPQLSKQNPELIRSWQRRYGEGSNVVFHLSDNLNVADLFLNHGALVSDVSSVALAWLALDRPLICYTDRSAAEQSNRYAPDGIEWAAQEAATVVERGSELQIAIASALTNPSNKSVERAKWRFALFGRYQDGQASERIADRIEQVLERKLR